MIEQTQFLSSVFLLVNIYSGVNFCRKNVCGNFYLWELVFADHCNNCKYHKNKNPQKFCATWYHPFKFQSI